MRPARNRASPGHHDILSTSVSSFRSGSPLAEQVLARDIAECTDDDEDMSDGGAIDDSHDTDHAFGHTMYRRPSGVAYGVSRPVFNPQSADGPAMTPLERKQSRHAEQSLLRDNHVLPPKHPVRRQTLFGRLYNTLFSTKVPSRDAEAPHITVQPPTETSPLLRDGNGAAISDDDDDLEDDIEDQWEQALASGGLRTTWQRETKTIATYSVPLIVTFVLQYSINVASIFTVGRIGKMELGAVSLANMSAAITCIAPFQGLATSLDTLCAQAYGSGHKHLVGLQFQRMTAFLVCMSVPISVIWWFAEDILKHMIPEPEAARLAGLYLRVMIFSIPGLIVFECGKRFTQAQGLFHATTYVLVLVAPFNAVLMWFLVWKLNWGFIGAPIAVAVTENIMPILLFLYVKFIDGHQCWGGFSKKALRNWWPMVKLALPGMIMVEAEWLAFEIMTLLSSRFGAEYLAAQSVVTTLASISYQIPFPVSIASSTRTANLIGANLVDAAKITAKVAGVASLLIGCLNLTIFSSLRFQLPLLFTNDPDVIKIVAHALPVVAISQLFDGISAGAHGLLRGIGKQAIGGPANLFAYYVISLPISLGLAFGLDWKLEGMWMGISVGLMVASTIEYIYLWRTDWQVAANEAAARNAAG